MKSNWQVINQMILETLNKLTLADMNKPLKINLAIEPV